MFIYFSTNKFKKNLSRKVEFCVTIQLIVYYTVNSL